MVSPPGEAGPKGIRGEKTVRKRWTEWSTDWSQYPRVGTRRPQAGRIIDPLRDPSRPVGGPPLYVPHRRDEDDTEGAALPPIEQRGASFLRVEERLVRFTTRRKRSCPK